ncbi:hypothetical protein ACHHV8_21370 [Paenibacillus sp. TAB 01]|uniref:hypothetical protein n=1 Tax=Paenibacillus sp. TAB 01 TaxID=3368988 RepID=UPI00375345A1
MKEIRGQPRIVSMFRTRSKEFSAASSADGRPLLSARKAMGIGIQVNARLCAAGLFYQLH